MWAVTGSFAKYVAAISNSIADQSSAAGNPQTVSVLLLPGPDINATGPSHSTPDAIKAVFAWYDTNKTNLVLVGNPTIPGLTPRIGPNLHSPFTYEYSSGVSRQFNRASLRADVTYRKYHDFYASIIDWIDRQGDQQLRSVVRPCADRKHRLCSNGSTRV